MPPLLPDASTARSRLQRRVSAATHPAVTVTHRPARPRQQARHQSRWTCDGDSGVFGSRLLLMIAGPQADGRLASQARCFPTDWRARASHAPHKMAAGEIAATTAARSCLMLTTNYATEILFHPSSQSQRTRSCDRSRVMCALADPSAELLPVHLERHTACVGRCAINLSALRDWDWLGGGRVANQPRHALRCCG